MTINSKKYSNNDCTGTTGFDESDTESFVIGKAVMTTGGQTAKEIDITGNGATALIMELSIHEYHKSHPSRLSFSNIACDKHQKKP